MTTMSQPTEIHNSTDILAPIERRTFFIADKAKALYRRCLSLLPVAICDKVSIFRVYSKDISLRTADAVQSMLIGRYVSREVLWMSFVDLYRRNMLSTSKVIRETVPGNLVRRQTRWIRPSRAVQHVDVRILGLMYVHPRVSARCPPDVLDAQRIVLVFAIEYDGVGVRMTKGADEETAFHDGWIFPRRY